LQLDPGLTRVCPRRIGFSVVYRYIIYFYLYDKKNVFLFAAIQSKTGKAITKELGIDISKLDSILLYVPEEAYYSKSNAALKIAKEFSGYWKLLQICTLLPDFFNDFFYDYIARNRYKWFGKQENCMIPTPSLKAKFLE